MNLDFGSNHQLVYRSEGLSLETSVTGSPVTWSGSSAVLVSDGFCNDAFAPASSPVLDSVSRLSLRVPGDTGMRPWTKDV